MRQVLRLALLVVVAIPSLGAGCWSFGTGGTADPPKPPIALTHPNAFVCPIECTSMRTLETLTDLSTPLCVPAAFNSNLPGGPVFTEANWQRLNQDHCNNVTTRFVEILLNTRHSTPNRPVCDFNCRVLSQSEAPLRFSSWRDKQCNQPCTGFDVCDQCAFVAPCLKNICNPSGNVDPPYDATVKHNRQDFAITGDDDSLTLTSGKESATVRVRGNVRIFEPACPTCRLTGSIMLTADELTIAGTTFKELRLKTGGFADFEVISGIGPVIVIPEGSMRVTIESVVAGQESYLATTNDLAILGALVGPVLTLDFQLPVGEDERVTVHIRSTTANRWPTAVATLPASVFECQGPAGAPITLFGSASTDPDSNIVGYSWFRLDGAMPKFIGDTADLMTVAPFGVSSYRLRVSDSFAQTSEATVLVEVVDTVPPVLQSVTADRTCLWPPNHKWAELELGSSISVAATDVCSQAVQVRITSVVVLENGVLLNPAAHTLVAQGGQSVCLAATRAGASAGRTYSIGLSLVDAHGNSSPGTLDVRVPHDSSGTGRCIESAQPVSKICPE